MFKKVFIASIVIAVLCTMAFSIDTAPKEERFQDAPVNTYDTYEPIVVLELFTSQGCSSCPAADVLLDKVKQENPETVFALSYHVDYWNYIGWEDPFSNASYSQKQNAYNVKFGYRSNYTPEVVVNGKEHFVGSDASKMQQTIDFYVKSKTANHIEIDNGKVDGSILNFDYKVAGDLDKRSIRTVLVLNERTTNVKRGENRNRTIKNSNIVIAEKTTVLKESEGALSMTVPDIVKPGEKLFLMVFIENAEKDITAAAKWGFKGQ